MYDKMGIFRKIKKDFTGYELMISFRMPNQSPFAILLNHYILWGIILYDFVDAFIHEFMSPLKESSCSLANS